MRIQVRGGIWTNVEDELLKVAAMKYGLNAWNRVASFLTRKSATQCKARWYEWLDPNIKKIEWSREEEEKLLHLAKTMPTQWRTIAPIIGRTAAQCLEHYEKLLDRAQMIDGKESIDTSIDPHAVQVGEIDPHPETRPARADAVDMDDDDKEMVNEAMARLANTKGKKATRKMREIRFAETKRLAILQKKRELRAAGIESRKRKRVSNKEMDLINEIPFQKVPAPGFYDVSEEIIQTKKAKGNHKKFIGMDKRFIDGEKNDEEEERKKDIAKNRIKKKLNAPEAYLKSLALNDPGKYHNREKLILPEPQITDNELHTIAKLTQSMQPPSSRSSSSSSSSRATDTLLSAYDDHNNDTLPTLGMTNVANRTPMVKDHIMEEAKKLAIMQRTPNIGEQAILRNQTEMNTKYEIQSTPNLLKTKLMTPRNTDKKQYEQYKKEKQFKRQKKNDISGGLKSMPEPQNEYGLVLPEVPKYIDNNIMEIDADEVEYLKEKKISLEYENALKRRTSVIQKELPRPIAFNPEQFIINDNQNDNIHMLVQDEMKKLMKFDDVNYPIKKSKKSKNNKNNNVLIPQFSYFDCLNKAKTLVHNQVNEMEEKTLNFDSQEELLFIPSQKKFGFLSDIKNETERLQAIRQLYTVTMREAEQEERIVDKLSKKAGILFKGYEIRCNTFSNKVNELNGQKLAYTNGLIGLTSLSDMETKALPHRIKFWQKLVDEQKDKYKQAQERYLELTRIIATI